MPETNPVQNMNEMAARLRVLESKVNLVKNDLSITNTNLLEENKRQLAKIRIQEQELKETKHELQMTKETIKHLIEESSEFARKQDLKVLEKYINMWNPLKYITETEAKEIAKRQLKELLDLQAENEDAT